MNRNVLRRIDFNLLIVFETLMHERSVTKTAEKLFLGQPAISAALRTLFNDELFARTGRTMEPTTRALQIFPGFLTRRSLFRLRRLSGIQPGHDQHLPHRPVRRRRICRPALAAPAGRAPGVVCGAAGQLSVPPRSSGEVSVAVASTICGKCQEADRATNRAKMRRATPGQAHSGRILRAAPCHRLLRR